MVASQRRQADAGQQLSKRGLMVQSEQVFVYAQSDAVTGFDAVFDINNSDPGVIEFFAVETQLPSRERQS
jgi:hypothetical protein